MFVHAPLANLQVSFLDAPPTRIMPAAEREYEICGTSVGAGEWVIFNCDHAPFLNSHVSFNFVPIESVPPNNTRAWSSAS
jgi:hypothetical protein